MKKRSPPDSKLARQHLPCPDCGSSDALAEYDDGHSFCFSCGKRRSARWRQNQGVRAKALYSTISNTTIGSSLEEPIYIKESNIPKDAIVPKVAIDTKGLSIGTTISTTISRDTPEAGPQGHAEPPKSVLKITAPYRGITPSTYAKFGVETNEVNGGIQFSFPYGRAFKYRPKDTKRFAAGPGFTEAGLFGQERFNQGSAKAITITEGEFDAMSVYQMLGSQYPVVSVKTGAQGARRDCENNRDYLNSFEKIYLCFDNDEPGRKAEEQVAGLFDPNKVYIVHLDKHKDANEALDSGDEKAFVRAWWNAKRWRPKGIISGYDEVSKLLTSPDADAVAHLPFKQLDEKLCGIRFGEVNLFTALEGVGKTEVMGAIEHHLLKTTDYNMAIIHLEETEKKAIQRLVTYELGVGVHRPDNAIPTEEQLEVYKRITKRDDRVFYYKHFGSDDDDIILDIIRHLVVVHGCKFIFLDHITMLVTGTDGAEQTQRLDYLSTKLAQMSIDLSFCLFLVSHENDDGKTRGSRNISKVASLWVRLTRDVESIDPETRMTTVMSIKKNRFGSDTGPGGNLKFDRNTFKLGEVIAEASSQYLAEPGTPKTEDLEKAPLVAYKKLS